MTPHGRCPGFHWAYIGQSTEQPRHLGRSSAHSCRFILKSPAPCGMQDCHHMLTEPGIDDVQTSTPLFVALGLHLLSYAHSIRTESYLVFGVINMQSAVSLYFALERYKGGYITRQVSFC